VKQNQQILEENQNLKNLLVNS